MERLRHPDIFIFHADGGHSLLIVPRGWEKLEMKLQTLRTKTQGLCWKCFDPEFVLHLLQVRYNSISQSDEMLMGQVTNLSIFELIFSYPHYPSPIEITSIGPLCWKSEGVRVQS